MSEARQIIDYACARFGVGDMIAGLSDQEVYRKVAPWLMAHSLPQLRQQLQARLPANMQLDSVVDQGTQQQVYAVLHSWQRQYG